MANLILAMAICAVISCIWSMVRNESGGEFFIRLIFMMGMSVIWHFIINGGL